MRLEEDDDPPVAGELPRRGQNCLDPCGMMAVVVEQAHASSRLPVIF